MSILVYLEHDADGIKAGSLSAVAAAKQIGGDITALVAGDGSQIFSKNAVSINV